MQQPNSHNITNLSLESQLSSGVLGICFLLGVPGNILVVLLILRLANRDNFTLHLMLNLAAADLLCLLPAPFSIYNLLVGWHIGVFLCKALYFTLYLSIYVSVLTIMLISVHRLLFVVYRSYWIRLGQRGERILLVALWVIASVCSIGFTHTYGVNLDGTRQYCGRIDVSDQDRVALLLVETVFIFFLPISVITTSYCCLHRRVNQTAFFSRSPEHTRLTRLVTSIVVTFLILWIPLQCANLLEVFAISVKSHNPPLYAKLLAIKKVCKPIVWSLTFINSCVNPLLYFFNYRKIRPNMPISVWTVSATRTNGQHN